MPHCSNAATGVAFIRDRHEAMPATAATMTTITHQMNLDVVAEAMGPYATREDAVAMRRILLARWAGRALEEISEPEWQDAMEEAVV